jgi:glycosyltransferase involved in cell wall biosynthesis
MRLLFVTQYFTPEPITKIRFLARALAARGHKVTVLTSLPCWPLGKIHPEYKGVYYKTEQMDGFEVIRVPQIPDHSSSAIRRIIYYFSFPFFAAVRIPLMVPRRYDAAYFYGAAIPVLGLAPLVRTFLGAKCVFDIVDLWPESVEATGMLRSPKLLKMVSALSTFLYTRADFITTATHGFKQRLEERGVRPEKMRAANCISNLEESHPAPVYTTDAEAFVVAYTGGIGPPQELMVLIEAARVLRESSNLKFRFVIAGSGLDLPRLVERARELKLDNIEFLGQLPPEQMGSIYDSAEALLVHLKPDCLSTVSIPSKTYFYMAAGKPIIMGVDGEAGEFVEEIGCGFKCKAGDAHALADSILKLAKMPVEERKQIGLRGRKAFDERFSSASQIELWENIFREISAR